MKRSTARFSRARSWIRAGAGLGCEGSFVYIARAASEMVAISPRSMVRSKMVEEGQGGVVIGSFQIPLGRRVVGSSLSGSPYRPSPFRVGPVRSQFHGKKNYETR